MKHKKGFTLIEVVVVIVLTSVLLAVLVPILPAAQKQVYHTQNVTAAAQSGESIYKYIVDTLDGADRIWIGNNDTNKPSDSENWNTITVQDGVLLINENTVYDQDYQRGCMLTLSANGSGRTSIELGIELTKITGDKSEVLYTQNSAFSPARMNSSSFSCIEGSIGTQIATMSYSADGISTQSDTPQLVIYFQMAQSEPIPTFTPSTDPDATITPSTPAPIPTLEPTESTEPEPTLAPSNLYVSLPDTLVINVGDSNVQLIPDVKIPENVPERSVKYEWDGLDINSNISIDKIWGFNDNITECYVTGKAVTEQLVTLTVSYVLDNITYSASASCTIIVQKNSTPPQLSDNIEIYEGYWGSVGNSANLAGKTIFANTRDGTINIGAYPKSNSTPITGGNWEIIMSIDAEGKTADGKVANLAISDNNAICSISPISSETEGIVTICFTAGNNAPENIQNKSTTITIIFYDGYDYTSNSNIIRLDSYLTNEASINDRKVLTLDYDYTSIPFTNYVVTLEIKAQGVAADIIRKKLNDAPLVQLSSITYDRWNGNYTCMDVWQGSDGVSSPYTVIRPDTQTLSSCGNDLYQAIFPLEFNTSHLVTFGYSHHFYLKTWIFEEDASQHYGKDVWFHPSSVGLDPNAKVTVQSPIPHLYSNLSDQELTSYTAYRVSESDPFIVNAYKDSGEPLLGSYRIDGTLLTDEYVSSYTFSNLKPGSYTIVFNSANCTEYSVQFTLIVTPSTQLYKGENNAVTQIDGQWIGQYSPNIRNQTVFVNTSENYTLGCYSTEFLDNCILEGTWRVVKSLNANGETDENILTDNTKNILQNQTILLNVSAQKEGIVVLEHSSTGNSYTTDFNYNRYDDIFRSLVSQTTFIFYDAEKVANGTSELLRSTLTLTSTSGESGLNTLSTAYTASGNKFASATFTLEVVPKWNWDYSKTNVEEIIRNALETNPPNVSLSTRLNSMSSWSDVSSIAKPQPNSVPLIASSKNGVYQATFPLSFSDYIPTADLTTSLYAWIWTENSSILGNINKLFDPTLPNRCTITVKQPEISIYTGEVKTINSRLIEQLLEVSSGSELALSAYNYAGQQLPGTWQIINNSTKKVVYSSSSIEYFCPKSVISKLSSDQYTVTFSGSESPYNRSVSFQLIVKAGSTNIVAYKMDYSQASDVNALTQYSNLNSCLTVYFGNKLDLYAYLCKNGATPSSVSGTWKITYESGDPPVLGTIQSFTSNYISVNTIEPENATKDSYTVSITFEPSNTTGFLPTDDKTLSLTVIVKKSALKEFTKINGDENWTTAIIRQKGNTLSIQLPNTFLPNKKFRWLINDTVLYSGEASNVSGKYGKSKNNKDLFSYSISDLGRTLLLTTEQTTGNGNLSDTPHTLTLQYSDDGKLWTTYDSLDFKG